MTATCQKALHSALRLLANREHGAEELVVKLTRKGFAVAEARDAVLAAQDLGLQDDRRFVENVCTARIRQGYGPLKIAQELQSKQIDRDLVESVLAEEQDNWVTHALRVWEKKYKEKDTREAHIKEEEQE